MIAMVAHNVSVSTTLGGGVSGTIAAVTVGADGTYPHSYVAISPAAGVSSITLSLSGNAQTVVVGEILAGEYTSLTLPYFSSDELSEDDFARERDIDMASTPGYDSGLGSARVWSCEWPVLSASELAGLIAAKKGQRNKTRPMVVVRQSTVNDAMCGYITELTYHGAPRYNTYEVSMTFQEIPPIRWIG